MYFNILFNKRKLKLKCTNEAASINYNNLYILIGRPRPYVFWRKGSSVIQGTVSVDENGLVRNELIFDRLKREDLLTVLVCQASNNNFTSPVHASVTIDLNCKYFV